VASWSAELGTLNLRSRNSRRFFPRYPPVAFDEKAQAPHRRRFIAIPKRTDGHRESGEHITKESPAVLPRRGRESSQPGARVGPPPVRSCLAYTNVRSLGKLGAMKLRRALKMRLDLKRGFADLPARHE